jgi:hypothetical protein
MSAGLALVAPLAAHAGPLLSGYGGPGQGNQAILGSTLIGGSGGSGGSGGGGAETSVSAAGSTASSAGVSAAHTATGAARANASGGSPRSGSRGGSGAGSASARSAAPLGGALSERSYHGPESAGGSSALGLSAPDVIYIVLAAVALAFTGVLTRRLAGTRTAKGLS